MTHDEFREAMTKALLAKGGTFVSTEADPWDPADEDCTNEFHPGYRTQVDFPHWIVFLSSDDDPDWNDTEDEDVAFDLAAYFQHIISLNFDEANAAVADSLPEGWLLETVGEGVPGFWLSTTIDFDRREDFQAIIDELIESCNVVHERIGAWPNAPKIERLI